MGACLSKAGGAGPGPSGGVGDGRPGGGVTPKAEPGEATVSPFTAEAQTHGTGNGAVPPALAEEGLAGDALQPFPPASPTAGKLRGGASGRGERSALDTLASSSSMGSSLGVPRPPLEPPCTTELADGDPFPGPPPLDPAAEKTRVYALKRLGVGYTSREPSLDFITRLVTSVCAVQAAVMSFTDSRRAYIKSAAGGFEDVESIDRRLAISVWNLTPLNPEVLVVEDLAADARFKAHPFVRGAPGLRFYASVPLLDASGQRVGALSVMDTAPRKLDADACSVLCNFAEMLMREVGRVSEAALQRKSVSQGPENEQMLRWIDACSDGVVLLDIRVTRWPILFSNEGWTEVTGLSPVSGSLKCFWDVFQLPGVGASQQPWQLYADAVEHGETFKLDVILTGSSGKHLYTVVFKPVSEALDDGMVSIKVPARQASAAQALPPSQPAPARLFYFGTIHTAAEDGTLGSAAGVGAPSPAADEDASKPPIPGVRLGPLLGRGSFGSVYYGTWNGAQIAVKVIQHMATEAERVARDEQLEAILGLKMLHPNIVRTFQFATKDRSGSKPATLPERTRVELNHGSRNSDAATPAGQRRMMETWIVLELCNRGSLQGAIDKGAFKQRGGAGEEGAPNMVNITRTATEIAGAMTYLHSLDILHSDLNGNNILLISNTGIDDRPFSIKVSDFGLSRIHIGERTVATQTYGTVTHMPPELLSEGRLSKAADVYAFGVLLWEMYTGQRPWAGLRHVQIITHKMRNGTQLKWPAHVHPAFKDLAQRCMHPNPHQRPTFGEVLDLLEPIRDLAERGELRFEAAPEAEEPPGREMGALLGRVHQIPEEEEQPAGGAPAP